MCIFLLETNALHAFFTLKESNPTFLHCAHLLLLLSRGLVTTSSIFGHEQATRRERKILSSIVEVMEVSDNGDDFHISDENLP